MKAIMRCLSVAKEDVVPLTGDLLGKFNEVSICTNGGLHVLRGVAPHD
jgi:hypothetical protein